MKTIQIQRKKQFRSALVPYWIIAGVSKEEFMRSMGFEGDVVPHNEIGQAIPRIDISVLDQLGMRIENGQTIVLEAEEDVTSLFASTMDGTLSNEILLPPAGEAKVLITTAGGWTNVSYPVLEFSE